MIKGLYAAASAMLANMERQKTLAHNASNLETIGFKQIVTSLNDYALSRVTYAPGNITNTNTLERIGYIGLGANDGPEVTDFNTGGMKYTGNLYDFAINGEGFFMIQTPDGERYTRDGRFLKDANNQLVTAVGGYFVLDTNGQTITLPEGEPGVSPEGEIDINGEIAAQISLAAFEDSQAELERAGENLFSSEDAPTSTEYGSIAQGYLEMSNVNVSHLITQMAMVTRSYEAAQKMVVSQDDLLNKTIQQLG